MPPAACPAGPPRFPFAGPPEPRARDGAGLLAPCPVPGILHSDLYGIDPRIGPPAGERATPTPALPPPAGTAGEGSPAAGGDDPLGPLGALDAPGPLAGSFDPLKLLTFGIVGAGSVAVVGFMGYDVLRRRRLPPGARLRK